ncbi:MAG: PilC/PilY family type IV pilus protein [Pseudomonadaceae bacterium]|nr:PilC/PilY family type IV pilus protein [Pseudomonadaceae bacterium]
MTSFTSSPAVTVASLRKLLRAPAWLALVVGFASASAHAAPPFVDNPIGPVVRAEDSPNASFFLNNLFDDPDGDDLLFSIVSNSNSALISANLTFGGDVVQLDFAPDGFGTGTVVVRATEDILLLPQSVDYAIDITVNPVNDAPTVVAPISPVAMNEDEAQRTVSLASVFGDVENDALVYSLVSNSNTAMVNASVVGNNALLDLSFNTNGSATITVRATEQTTPEGFSVDESFVLNVAPVNDPPIVPSPIADQNVAEDASPVVISLAGVFSDPEGEALGFGVTGNSNGALVATSVVGDELTLTFAPDAHGSATITVGAMETVSSPALSITDTFEVTVSPVNDAPTASPATSLQVIAEDSSPPTSSLSTIFTDPDVATASDSLTYALSGSTGTTVFTPTVDPSTGQVDFGAPVANANGQQIFTFKATDLAGADATFTLTVDITAVNDAPTVVAPIGVVNMNEDQPNLTIDLSTVFDDVDIATNGDVLTFTVASNDNTALFDSAAILGNSLELDLAADAVGNANITIVATDSAGATVSDTAQVVVAVVQPIAVDDSATVDEDTGTLTIPVFTNDTRGDDPTVIISVGRSWTDPNTGLTYGGVSESDPTVQFDETGTEFTEPNGSVSVDGDNILYTPKDNYSGNDWFFYTIRDADGDESTARVDVIINGDNDAPRIIGAPQYDVMQGEFIDVGTSGGLLGYVIDDDGDPITASIVAFPSQQVSFTLNSDGSFSYTPDPSYGDDPGEETDSFVVQFSDDNGLLSGLMTVIINIDEVEVIVAPSPPGEVEFDFDLADVPLEDAIAAEANVLVIMDDSGSMDWGHMTDQANGLPYVSNNNVRTGGVNSYTRYFYYLYSLPTNIYGNGRVMPTEEALNADADFAGNDYGLWRARYSGWSTTYYDPEINYEPWVGLDRNGSEFPDSDPANAMLDPNDVTLQYIDLTAPQTWWSNAVPRVNGPSGSRWKNVLNSNIYLPYYYTTTVSGKPAWNDPHTKVDILPGNAPFDGGDERDDCLIPTACTYAEELQNFANWFTYYRIREHAAKGALGAAVADASNLRMGYAAMNQSFERLRIDSLNSSFRVGHKKDLMDQIYRTRSNGGTPLRRALDRAGRHFQCVSGDSFGSTGTSTPGTANCPVLADPEGQCQNNYTLLFSDGTWNGGFSGTGAANHDSDNPADITPSAFDGGRYADNRTATLADVAMYYYERDLHPSLVDGVPTSERDRLGADESNFGNEGETMHQHMKTYTVGFGLNGSIDPATVPTDYTQAFTWSNPFNGGSAKVDDMLHAAVNGRGDFLQANNPVLLSAAFQQAFAEFSDGSVSVSAVAFNSTALREETVEYRGFFNLKFNSGDLRALSVDPDNGEVDNDNPIWRAAPELDTVTPDSRVIVTFDRQSGDGIPFRYANLNTDQQTVLDAQELAFLRGDRSNEEPSGTFRERRATEGILGDIVHSAPVYVGTPRAIQRDAEPYPTASASLYSQFVDDSRTRQAAVYVAANDGMLHAFNAGIPGTNLGDGAELFAFVPNKIIDSSQRFQNELDQLSSLVYSHKFFVDLTPTIEDVFMPARRGLTTKTWNTLLVGGLGGGGKGYYALNVTDVDDWDTETNAANNVLWEFTDADDFYPLDSDGDPIEDSMGNPVVDLAGDPVKDLGYSFSQPQIVMSNVDDGSGEQKWIAVFGNGYNSTAGIAKLFALFIEDGMDGWDADEVVKLDTGEGVKDAPDPLAGLPNGLGTPTVIDVDLNGTADYVYAGDLFGNMYRFDITDADPDNWTSTKLFQATYDETTATRQAAINKPTVTKHPTEEGFLIIFGTGSFVTEQDGTSTDIQSLYGLWDRFEIAPATNVSNAKSTRLVEQVLTNKVVESGFAFDRFRIVTENAVNYVPDAGSTPGTYGWYIDFDPVRAASTDQGNSNPDTSGNAPPDVQYPGERAVRRLIVRNGVVIVVSILPREENTCFKAPPGNVMAFDALTGGNPSQPVFDLNGDGEVDDSDLLTFGGDTYAGGIMLDQGDLDGTLVDPSVLSGTGDTDFLFLSGGSQQETIEIFGVGGPKTGRLSWRELDDGI